MNPRRLDLALTALVFVIPVLLHLRTIGFQFIWDDDANVTANALLVGPDQLRRIWTGQDIYQFYPLTFTTYWLQDRLIGLSAGSCHAINVLLHGLVSAGLYSVLRQLRVPGAFWGALLFGVHPLATESVAWVTERKNLLAGLFSVGSVSAYLLASRVSRRGTGSFGPRPRGFARFRPRRTGSGSGHPFLFLALSFGLFVLAVLSKTHAVVLPAFLVLLSVLPSGPQVSLLRSAARLLPFFVVSAVFSILTVHFERRHVLRDGADWEWAWTLPERIVIAGKVLSFYLAKAIWPQSLAFIYDPWTIDASSPVEWIPAISWGLGIAALLGLVVRSARRPRGSGGTQAHDHAPTADPNRAGRPEGRLEPTFFLAALVVALGFVLWLTPVLGFLRVYFFRYAFVQDHFVYFALLVLVPGVTAGITWSLRKPGPQGDKTPGTAASWAAGHDVVARRDLGGMPAQVAFTAIGCVLAVLTWRHQEDFRDPETLWTRTVETSPRAWMAWTNLGLLRYAEGRFEEAAAHHRRAVEIDDRRAEPHNNLGTALEAMGDMEGAIAEYRLGTEAEPNDPVGFCNLGNALVRAGRLVEATRAYEEALKRNSEYPQALNGLGVALAQSGRMQAAAERWAAAIVLAPGLRDPFANLARILEQELAVGTGIDTMRRASEATGGNNPAVEVLYARCWLRLGDFQEAVLAITRAEVAVYDLGSPWLSAEILETRLAIAR